MSNLFLETVTAFGKGFIDGGGSFGGGQDDGFIGRQDAMAYSSILSQQQERELKKKREERERKRFEQEEKGYKGQNLQRDLTEKMLQSQLNSFNKEQYEETLQNVNQRKLYESQLARDKAQVDADTYNVEEQKNLRRLSNLGEKERLISKLGTVDELTERGIDVEPFSMALTEHITNKVLRKSVGSMKQTGSSTSADVYDKKEKVDDGINFLKAMGSLRELRSPRVCLMYF